MSPVGLAYVRVSSRSQDHAMQQKRHRACRGSAWRRDPDWRAEKRSGKTMAREELRRLIVDARSGRLRGKRLYVFRLDRLTRTGIADMLVTLEELRTSGVQVVSVADGFDLTGPDSEGDRRGHGVGGEDGSARDSRPHRGCARTHRGYRIAPKFVGHLHR